MPSFKVTVTVRLKQGVLDPQGKAIEGALTSLDFSGVKGVRQGKVFDMVLEAKDAKEAEKAALKMADKLLANTVVEDFQVEFA
jgi:phosphoribosylformylglycinamidine synthase